MFSFFTEFLATLESQSCYNETRSREDQNHYHKHMNGNAHKGMQTNIIGPQRPKSILNVISTELCDVLSAYKLSYCDLGTEGTETRNRKNHSTNRSSSKATQEEPATETTSEYTSEQAEAVRR